MSPCHVGLREHRGASSNLDFSTACSRRCDERVHVPTWFWIILPIRILVRTQRAANVIQMSAPAVTPFVGCQSIKQSLIRAPLKVHIQRSVNSQAALMDLVAAILSFEIAAYFLDKIRCQRIRIMGQIQHQWLAASCGRLLRSDLAILQE